MAQLAVVLLALFAQMKRTETAPGSVEGELSRQRAAARVDLTIVRLLELDWRDMAMGEQLLIDVVLLFGVASQDPSSLPSRNMPSGGSSVAQRAGTSCRPLVTSHLKNGPASRSVRTAM